MTFRIVFRRIACTLSAISLICSTTPVAAQEKPLARSGPVRLVAPDVVGGWCQSTATVKAIVPTVPDYSAEDPVSQGITRALGTALTFECPTARAVRIEGVSESGEHFISAAEAAMNWRLMPTGALGAGPVAARIDENGFMPTHWTGVVNVHSQEVTRDAIRENDRTAQAGLYPQPDGRIRVSLGRCEGQLVPVTRAELASVALRIGNQERLYKMVQPRTPFQTGGGRYGAVCSSTSTTTNWLVLSTLPDSTINFRAIVRDTVDRDRRDRVLVETVMGALTPVYPAAPQTIAQARASASTDGPDWVGAGMLLMVGLLAASMWPGGGFGGGGGSGSGHDEYAEYVHDRNQGSTSSGPTYSPPAPTSGLYGDCHGGAAYGC